MKGVVFTEFFEMVEHTFSAGMVDDLIDDTGPASGGAYTAAVGTYDHGEIVAMVGALSQRSGIPVPVLLHSMLYRSPITVERTPIEPGVEHFTSTRAEP